MTIEPFALVAPELDRFSGSWFVVRNEDGACLGEFYDARSVAKFNGATCRAETAYQYLCRVNAEIVAGSTKYNAK